MYSRDADTNAVLERIEREFPDRSHYVRGYWIKTLERIFALDLIARQFPEAPIVHLESDVLLLAGEKELRLVAQQLAVPGVPMVSTGVGCASILIAPNGRALGCAIFAMRELLAQSEEWTDDMRLLGLAVERGILQELPSRPGQQMLIDDHPVVFDGLAIGQYIAGRDPFHTEGSIVSGYVPPEYAIDLSKARWSIGQVDSSLHLQWEGEDVRILNLHVHSKRLLPLPSLAEPWITLLAEANGEQPRRPMKPQIQTIHRSHRANIVRITLAVRSPRWALRRLHSRMRGS